MPGRHLQFSRHLPAVYFDNQGILTSCQGLPQSWDDHRRTSFDHIVISRVAKGQGQDAEVDEIGLVDPGETLDQLYLDAKITGCQGGMLPGRPLTIVLPPDNQTAGRLLGPFDKIRI